jgi:hypothetical protein
MPAQFFQEQFEGNRAKDGYPDPELPILLIHISGLPGKVS